MIERHFLFKAVQEVNEELTKNKEGFLIGFTSRWHKFFNEQPLFNWKIKGYMTEDEWLGINLVHKDFY